MASSELTGAEKRAERARVRGRMLVLVEPAARDAPSGTCRWCGDRIIEGGEVNRRRSYHHGEEAWRYGGRPRPGEPDCWTEWQRSRTWDARIALRRLAELEGEPLRCADCGRVCEGAEPVDGLNQDVPWDADHEVPLEDGGEHSVENLRCRCVPCHRAKTGAEARRRARRRREERAQQLTWGDFL